MRLARGVVPGIGGGGVAQAGAARRAGRDRLSARKGRRAPRARTTGTASAGRHRTHAVPGPASPARCAGGGRAFASRHLRGRRNSSRFPAPGGARIPVGLTPHVRATVPLRDHERSTTTTGQTFNPRATARLPGVRRPTEPAPSYRTEGASRSCVRTPGRGDGRRGARGGRGAGLPVPMHMSYRSTGRDRVRCARARFDQPQVAPHDPSTLCVGANASVIPGTGA